MFESYVLVGCVTFGLVLGVDKSKTSGDTKKRHTKKNFRRSEKMCRAKPKMERFRRFSTVQVKMAYWGCKHEFSSIN